MRPRTFIAIVTTSIALAACVQAQPVPTTIPTTRPTTMPSAQAVIDHYIEATGGKAAYDSIKTRRAEGTFSMADLGIEGKMNIALRTDGNAIVTIEIPNIGVIRQGMTNGIVWMIHPTSGPRILTGDEASVTARSLRMSPEVSLDGYHDATVPDVVALNGRPAYRMLLTGEAGAVETRFYDVESGLLVRTIGKTQSELGELAVTSNFSDYEDVPPIRMAMKVQQMMPGMSPESAMTKVEHNVDLPDSLFVLPPEIVELQKHQAAKQAATQPAK